MSKTAILQADLARIVTTRPHATIKSDFMLYGRHPRRMWIYKVQFAHSTIGGVTYTWAEALERVCLAMKARPL